MEDILDIVYEYSKKRKIIDEKGLEDILRKYIDVENIYVINEINIIRRKEILFNNVLLGNYFDDFIEIYYSRLKAFIKYGDHASESILENNLCIFEKYLRANLFIVFICFHEFEHAKQKQITLENNFTSFENKLVFLEDYYLDNLGYNIIANCKYDSVTDQYEMSTLRYLLYSLTCEIQNRRYKKNYDISFLERQADINANKKIITMIDSIKKEIPKIYALEEDILQIRKLKNYDTCKISPTIDFFSNILGKKYSNMDDMPNYDLNKRLELGLPISMEEYTNELKLIK